MTLSLKLRSVFWRSKNAIREVNVDAEAVYAYGSDTIVTHTDLKVGAPAMLSSGPVPASAIVCNGNERHAHAVVAAGSCRAIARCCVTSARSS